MGLSRRDFIRLCTGTVAGYGVSSMFHPAVYTALADTLTGLRPPVLWLQGAGCTGCSISLLNSMHPLIADVLLRIISLDFHPTLMNLAGEPALDYMYRIAEKSPMGYILVVEGAVPTGAEGRYCVIGERDHKEITLMDTIAQLAPNALAIMPVGTCATYGGVTAAKGSVTEAVGVGYFLTSLGIVAPLINVPGCPAHPDWMVGTLALLLECIKDKGPQAGVAEMLELLDDEGRPTAFYGTNVHEECPFLPQFDESNFSKVLTDKSACRYELGCKGPASMCDSSTRMWNGHVNWCIENATCIGCTQPDFPDGMSPFYES